MKEHVYVSQALRYALMTATAMVLVVLFSSSAFAATRTWDGDTDLDWNDATNWDTDTLPQAGDDLVFDTDAVTFSTTTLNNDFTAGTSFNSLSFIGTGEAPILGGNSFELVAGITSTASYQSIENDITLNGNQTFQAGSLTLSGTLGLGTSDLTLDGNSFTFQDVISGSGNIDTLNEPSVYLVESNTMSGAISLATGDTLTVCEADSLGSGAGHTFASGSQVYFPVGETGTTTVSNDFSIGGTGSGSEDYQAAIQFTGGCAGGGAGGSDVDAPFEPNDLVGAGDVTFSGTVTLTSDTNIHAHSAVYFDTTITFSDLVKGGNSLDRTASFGATLVVNGTTQAAQDDFVTNYDDNQPSFQVYVYPGHVAVIDGTRNDVAVYAGGTLHGTGTVDEVVVFAGGILAPGNSPGCLSSGNLTLSGTFEVEIAGTTVCTEYDQTDVTGSVDVSGGTLDVTLLSSFEPADGDEFIIIANDGSDAVTGTFTGLAEGDTLTVGSTDFTISYAGGSGNDVVLTATATAGAPDTGFFLFTSAQPVAFAIVGVAALLVLVMNRQGAIFSARR